LCCIFIFVLDFETDLKIEISWRSAIERISELNKKEIRLHTKSVLMNIGAEERSRKSGLIAEHLYSLSAWTEAKSVLIFLPLPEEVNTYPIIDQACKAGKLVAVPRVFGKDLVFHDCIAAENFIESKIGIREPAPDEPLADPSELGMPIIVITPGLAFDREKRRLGRGGGFYDRFLKTLRSNPNIGFSPVAVCFSEQLLDSIPHEEHDEKVDFIVTDIGIIR
jgi:5-formyltetrahydrofolate cyclo-ligase